MWSELTWFMWSDFIFKWSEVQWSELSYGDVLGDKSAMYIRVTLYWGYLIVLWPFHLDILYCGRFNLHCACFNLFCNVCVCVRVGFVILVVLVICVPVFTVFCIICTVFLLIIIIIKRENALEMMRYVVSSFLKSRDFHNPSDFIALPHTMTLHKAVLSHALE